MCAPSNLLSLPAKSQATFSAEIWSQLCGAPAATLNLVGVGGDRLQREGLKSLFDFSEISVMGVTGRTGKLPR